MVAVNLVRIVINEKTHDQAVVLREKNGLRQIPIVIGFVEASSIQMKISGVESPRPLTHDLLALMVSALGAEAEHLVIDDLTGGTFFAKLRLRDKAGQVVVLDCRPSDGIALAVRLNIPIFIEEKVFTLAATSEL